MKHLIKFYFGDPYKDGHGKFEEITIKSNYSTEKLLINYNKAIKEYKLDFRSLCRESSIIPERYITALRELGCPIDKIFTDHDKSDKDYSCDVLQFKECLFFFIQLKLPKWKYEILEPKIFDHFGYGLLID